jgi:heat shock protein 1/8
LQKELEGVASPIMQRFYSQGGAPGGMPGGGMPGGGMPGGGMPGGGMPGGGMPGGAPGGDEGPSVEEVD